MANIQAIAMRNLQRREADFLKRTEQTKDIWPCPHYQNICGEYYARMLHHDPAKYACANKACHKGNRCQIDNPPQPTKTRKADRPVCGARTRAGGSCKAKVVHGKSKCRMHGGLSTGPKTQQGRAAIIASNKRRAKHRKNGQVSSAIS